MNIPEFYRHLNIFKYQIIKFFNTQYYCVADLVGRTGTSGEKILIDSYYAFGLYPTAQQGGWYFVYDTTKAKSNHNGITVISPTVSWAGTQATVADFQAGTGETDSSGNGCWVLKSNELNIFMAGAVGDGSTDDTTAKTNAEAITSYDYVYWPKTTSFYVLTTAPTLGKSWGQGTIKISGAQVYLHPLREPVYGIYASVFGPYTTTAAGDSSPMLQKAIDFAQDNDLPVIFQPKAKYKLNTGLTFKHGKSSSDTMTYNVRAIGNGATFYPNTSVVAMSVVPRCLLADAGTGRGIAIIDIENITFDGFFAPTTAKAYVIGVAGYSCAVLRWGRVENVLAQSFNSSNPVFLYTECRHINHTNFTARTGAPVKFEAITNSSFCGDFNFIASEFAGEVAKKPLEFVSSATGSVVRGFSFTSCDIYSSGTTFTSSGNGSQIGDVWFDGGCQFDGPDAPAGEVAITIEATGTNSKITGIHFVEAYMVNYTGAVVKVTSTGSGATIYKCDINGGQISLITGDAASGNAAIYGDAIESFSIRNVEFHDVTATHLININDSTNILAHNNKAVSCTATNGVTISGTSDKYSVLGNVMNVTTVVNDTASGTTKSVDIGNLAI